MQKLVPSSLLALALATASFSIYAKSPAQWQAITSRVQVNLEQAVQHATQAVPGQVIDIELDDGDGAGPRYEVEVISANGDSIEVWVDAASGASNQHANDGKAKRKDVQRSRDAKITLPQAVQSALKHTPGKAVKAELDSHWGTTTYQVDVLQADHTVMEVKVDAANGTVIRAKRD